MNPTSRRGMTSAHVIGIAAGIALAIVGVAVAVVLLGRDTPPGPTPTNGEVAMPAGALTADGGGIRVGTGGPVLEVFEDFQCPACAAAESVLGAELSERVAAGENVVVFHPMVFLDDRLGNDSSLRAANAFGCAADQGKAVPFHNAAFSGQPEKEGTGYTDADLKTFAQKVGVADMPAFSACMAAGTYNAWARQANTYAFDRGIQSTPTFYIDGEELKLSDVKTLDGFIAAISGPSPAPSSS